MFDEREGERMMGKGGGGLGDTKNVGVDQVEGAPPRNGPGE
jgi:hypothetical protein